MTEFRITSRPGYNEPKHGQHGTEIHFALIGERGAFVWHFNTGVGPTGPWPSMDRDSPLLSEVNTSPQMSMGVYSHSEMTPDNVTESGNVINDNCEYLDGRACVGDYTHFSDNECMKAFASGGFDGVRKALEQKYLEHYGVAP